MGLSHKENEDMDWAKYGSAMACFLFGTIVSGIGYTYYGNIKFGSDIKNFPQSYSFMVAIGFLILGAPAVKAIFSMSPYYSNAGYFRITSLHFLGGVLGTSLLMFVNLLFRVL